MWDDVVIGTGNKGNSAVIVFAIEGDHGVSESGNAYWISDCYLDIGMTIFKNTEEGKRLSEMISQKMEWSVIKEWLDEVAIGGLAVAKLKVLIDRAIDQGFRNGRRATQADFRKCLGIVQ